MEKLNSGLLEAAKNGDTKSVEEWVARGADVNCKDEVGWSPLHVASHNGQTETVSRLVSLGADINIKTDDDGWSPLHAATARGHTETVSRLVSLGADINNKDNKYGHSPLHAASWQGHTETVSRLVSLGADIHIKDNNFGYSPLHRASARGHTETVSRLVSLGADINIKDTYGLSPLHVASLRGHTETVSRLVSLGADINIKDNDGMTPYDKADNDKIREILKMARDEEIARSVLQDLGLDTVSDFKQMLQQGSYKCFWNRVYLVGPYGVGKTTLAKLLVGEEIPDEWNSTDGIFIYLGRAAMDTESKKWVLLKKGTILNAAVMSFLKSRDNTSTVAEVTQPSQELSRADSITRPVPTEDSMLAAVGGVDSTTGPSKELQQGADSVTRPVSTEDSMLGAVGGVDSTTGPSKELQQGGPSNDEIIDLVLKECSQGDYKMIVIPVDIWDFGGQKIYYLTHQLFISSRGTFVVIFNGSTDINEDMPDKAFLPGFKGRTTTADFLLHWVNSILTFCEKTTTHSNKKYPRILFVATHKDKMTTGNLDQKRNDIKDSLRTLFRNHAGKDHLLIDQLFFLNAKDKNDNDLAALRDALLDVAFEHPSWGEPMPKKFVPLELQLAKQASEGKKILSITELEILNAKNERMSLQPKELATFLKVQHALGKLIYFDEDNLRDYVVTDPAYLIDVLRSIVTEKLFWPKEKVIREKFKKLSKTGIIKKSAILLLWQQTDFKQIFPFSEFMIKMLVRLDIMLEPETGSRYFIVPSMITDRPFKDTFKRKKCIYLAYQFTEQIIPPALLYRFLGSFIILRNSNTDIKKLHLFTDSAVVTIDSKHEVQAYVVGNRIILALMHEQSKLKIEPSIASTVQECLTRSIIGTTHFYSAISNTSHQKNMQFPFTIEFGVPCYDGLCYVEHHKIPAEKGQLWRCRQHKIQHSVNQMSLWFADKEPIQDEEKCAEGCTGLETSWMPLCPESRHLMRLGALLNHEQSRNLFLNLGLQKSKWENLETKFDKRDPEIMHFYALWHWRESAESPTFRLLLDALHKNEVNACVLCKVVRDIKFEGFPDDMMAWVPDDTTLEELSHHIGNATIQLGVELGLTVADLENIERNHKDLIEQTRKVLKKWKESSSLGENERPVIKLAKSLKRIGKYRLISNLNESFETRQHRKICVVM